jgi:hypothetical protein
MRSFVLLALVTSACSFDVAGVPPPPAPPSSLGGDDLGVLPTPSPTPTPPDPNPNPNPPPKPTPPPDLSAPPDLMQPPPNKQPLAIGAACLQNNDCASHFCATSIGTGSSATPLPGGYCSQDCSVLACPTGSSCISVSGGSKFCAADCTLATDCRSSYSCCDVMGLSVCVVTSTCSN